MAQKLWEKSVQVNKDIERFTVGRDREMDLDLAKHDVLGSMAHITMLESIGLLTKEELRQLLAELKEIYAMAERGEFVIEEGVEDVHSQVELMLTRNLGDIVATNVRFSIENPRALLYTNEVENTKSDWYLGAWTGARTDRKDHFWGNPNESSTYLNPSDGHKSIYDPCPKGYRVVSPRVLDEIEQKGEFVKQSATAVFKYCYDGTNYAYWPLAGCKWGSNGGNNGNNTGLDASKGAACYWSNSSASSYGNDKDQGATSLYYKVSDKTWTHSSGRSHAFSVRCMKDTENR